MSTQVVTTSGPTADALASARLLVEKAAEERDILREGIEKSIEAIDESIADATDKKNDTNKATNKELATYRYVAGKLIWQLRETFKNSAGKVYGEWGNHLAELCKHLNMSPRTADTLMNKAMGFVVAGKDDLGKAAAEAGLLGIPDASKVLVAAQLANPNKPPAEICTLVSSKIKDDTKVAQDALTEIKAHYVIGGKIDKVQKIERAEGGYKVTVRIAANVIPAGHEKVTVEMSSDQLHEVKGGVTATVTLLNSDAVSKFLAACGVSKVTAKDRDRLKRLQRQKEQRRASNHNSMGAAFSLIGRRSRSTSKS